jgi:putative ABC transport system substrate-binding protein
MKNAAVQLLLAAVILLAVAIVADAQQAKKVPRIGWLSGAPLFGNPERREAFRRGLRELGYVEGKNINIEWRSVDGKFDRVSAVATELVRLKVDVIVTGGSAVTSPTKEATSTIPIVMTQDSDPVGTGLVVSLARPGGNVTGLSNFAPELSGKRLEILREVVPKLSRVAVLGTSTVPGHSQMMGEIERAAKAFSVELQYLDVLDSKSIQNALRAARKGRAEAILTLQSAILVAERAQVIDLAVKNRLPAIYHNSLFIESGALMFYGVDVLDLDRRSAAFVDKILKGAKPADLPVEQPTKFEFVISLKAARQIGLTIPPNVLVRADRVIK